MRTRLAAPLVLAVLVAVLSAGCGKSPTSPVSSTAALQAQVTTALSGASTLVDESLAEDASPVPVAAAGFAPAGGASVQAAIHPYAWWRSITSETRTWSFVWADTDSTGKPKTCVATLHKHLAGALVIIPASPADSTQPDTGSIRKPLDETVTRKVLLRRLFLAGRDQWKVVAITGGLVTTPGAQTAIQSLRVQTTSGVDTMLTDPLQWHSLPRVLTFGTSDTVTVTVTTLRTDDLVYIHRWDWRHRLRNNGDGTYSFSWVTAPWSGWRHFGIQAMSRGSIYDDTLPYDSQAWHIPFRVAGGQPDVTYYP